MNVHLLIADWSETPMVDPRPCVARVVARPGGGWSIVVSVAVMRGGVPSREVAVMEIDVDLPHLGGGVSRTRLEYLGPGAWALTPSLVTPVLHGFVILRGAPDPAPWATP